jgi:tRNA (guanine37-N1)-methyltransferase
MTFHIVTLFPASFESYIKASIIGRALARRRVKVKFYNPRDYTKDKWRRIDRKPYGGGPGMVLEAQPVIKAVEAAFRSTKYDVRSTKKSKNRKSKIVPRILIVWLSPSGKQFDNKVAENYAKKFDHIIIICGRYEGIDARVKKILKAEGFKPEDISIGPYVVTGGELPAMVILDAVMRRLPGVLGKIESVEENRIASSEVYTRPEVLEYPPKSRAGKGKKYSVPKILLSGHHKKIEEWKINKKTK